MHMLDLLTLHNPVKKKILAKTALDPGTERKVVDGAKQLERSCWGNKQVFRLFLEKWEQAAERRGAFSPCPPEGLLPNGQHNTSLAR